MRESRRDAQRALPTSARRPTRIVWRDRGPRAEPSNRSLAGARVFSRHISHRPPLGRPCETIAIGLTADAGVTNETNAGAVGRLLAWALAGLLLRSGEVPVVLLRAVDRIGRRDVWIVEPLQLLNVFVGRVVIPGGRNRRHLVARLLLQDVESNHQSSGADRRRIAHRNADESVLLVVDQLLDETIVVSADERHKGLARGLDRFDHRIVDPRRPHSVEM